MATPPTVIQQSEDNDTITHRQQSQQLDTSPEPDQVWEDTLNLTNIGHGEWDNIEETNGNDNRAQNRVLEKDPEWIQKWRYKTDPDIQLHTDMLQGGYPNRWGARRPVKSKWNLDVFQEKLEGYPDMEIIEWLRYG